MKTIFYLEDRDVITKSDFCRQLDLEYVGQSDYLHTTNTYSGKPTNFTRWLQVERAGIPHFIGRTVGEFNSAMDSMDQPHQPVSLWEFVRGDIPKHAILPETSKEKTKKFFQKKVTIGKYKGSTYRELKTKDPDYFYWAWSNDILDRMGLFWHDIR